MINGEKKAALFLRLNKSRPKHLIAKLRGVIATQYDKK